MLSLRKILLAVDFSKTTEAAIAKTIILARKLRAEVIPLFVLGDRANSLKVNDEMKHIHEQYASKMETLVNRFHQQKIKIYHSLIHEGEPVDAILGVAERNGVDLIVLGAANEGKSLQSLGEITERIVRLAPAPVLVVHPQDYRNEINNVLCVIDSSAASDQTLDTAIFLCRELIAELHVLHIFDSGDMKGKSTLETKGKSAGISGGNQDIIFNFENVSELERSIYLIFKRKIRSSGLKYRLTARQGEAAMLVNEMGRQANSDLIVMGAIERNQNTIFYQPHTIADLLQQLPCSLLLIKHYNVADEDSPTVVISPTHI